MYAFEPTTDGPQTETAWGMIDDRTFGIVFSGTGTGTPGTPDLVVAPDPVTLSFGDVAVGTVSAPQTVTVTNHGTAGTWVQAFEQTTTPGGDPLPSTPFDFTGGCFGVPGSTSGESWLNPGQSCTAFSVTFTPTTDGPAKLVNPDGATTTTPS